MSKKWSSFGKQQLITENWRKFLNEEEVGSVAQAAEFIARKISPLIVKADAGNFTEPLRELVAQLNSDAGMSRAVRELLSAGDKICSPMMR